MLSQSYAPATVRFLDPTLPEDDEVFFIYYAHAKSSWKTGLNDMNGPLSNVARQTALR